MTDSKDVKAAEKPWEKDECKKPPPPPATFGPKDLIQSATIAEPAAPPLEPQEKHDLGLVGVTKEDEELMKKMPTATPAEIAAYKAYLARQKDKKPAPPPEAKKPNAA